MGCNAYWYVVKYQPDVAKALHELQEREFRAGRYSDYDSYYRTFPVRDNSPSSGARHATIDDAREAAGESGTASILDVYGLTETDEFAKAMKLGDDVLTRLYGSDRPTRTEFDIDRPDSLLEIIERSQSFYFFLYRDGRPDEIVFAGYSFD